MATFIKDLDWKRPWQIEKRLYKLKNEEFAMVSVIKLTNHYELAGFRCDEFGNVLSWSELFCYTSEKPDFKIDKIVNDYEDSL